jgi:hypothetical protein
MSRSKLVIIKQGFTSAPVNELLDDGWYVDAVYVLPGSARGYQQGSAGIEHLSGEFHYVLGKDDEPK